MATPWLLREIDSLGEHLTPRLARFLRAVYDHAVPESDESDLFKADKSAVIEHIQKTEGKALSSQDVRNRLRSINEAIQEKADHDDEPIGLTVASRKTHFQLEATGVAKMRSSRAALLESSSQDAKEIDDKAAKLKAVRRPEHLIFISHAWEDEEVEAVLDEFIKKLNIKLASFAARSEGRFSARGWIDRKDVKATSAEFTDCTDKACAKASIGLTMCSDKWFQSEPCQGERKILEETCPLICIQLSGDRKTTPFKNRPMFPELWETGYRNLLSVMSKDADTKDSFVSSVADAIYEALDTPNNPAPVDPNDEPRDGPSLQPKTPDRFDLSRKHDPAEMFEKAKASRSEISPKNTSTKGDGFYIVEHLCGWASDETSGNRMYAILGGFGSGKSTCSKQFVDEINSRYQKDRREPFAIYLDFRRLIEIMGQKEGPRPELGDILTLALRPEHRESIDKKNLVEMIQRENCIIVFDGLDEVGTGLGEDRAAALYRQLLETIPPEVRKSDMAADTPNWEACKTRLIVTCRTQFFRDHIQEDSVIRGQDRMVGMEKTHKRSNIEKLYMVPFNEAQIRSYFTANLGESTASQTFQFIQGVHDLLGLASKPLLMKYIMDMAPDLIADHKEGRVINLARVYYHIFRRVIERDGDKRPILEPDDRADILKALAHHLWVNDLTQIRAKELQDWFDHYVSEHPGLRMLYAGDRENRSLMLLELRNANLLRRDNDEFRFTHTSFYEYFLACSLFDQILSRKIASLTNINFVSVETFEFLQSAIESEGKELYFVEKCNEILRSTSPSAVRQFLLNVQEVRMPNGANFSDLTIGDALWHKLTEGQSEIREVNFSRANLKNTFLDGITFSKSKFDDTIMYGVTFRACIFSECSGRPLIGSQIRLEDSSELREIVSPKCQYIYESLSGSNLKELIDDNLPRRRSASEVKLASFSPKNTFLLSASHSNELCLWDVMPGEKSHSFTECEGSIEYLTFSEDGTMFLIGSDDKTSRIWDMLNKRELFRLIGHSGEVICGSFSFSGDLVVTGSTDNTARLWSLGNGELVACLEGHTGAILRTAFSPKNQTILTVSEDQTGRLWDANGGKEIQLISQSHGWMRHGIFSPNGRLVLTISGYSEVQLWDVANAELVANLQGHTHWVSNAIFSPSGDRVLTVSDDKTAKLWSLISGEVVSCFDGHNAWVHSGIFTPCGEQVVTISNDNTAKLWDVSSNSQLICYDKHEGYISGFDMSSDGKFLALFGQGLHIYDLTTGELLRSFSLRQGGGWVTQDCVSEKVVVGSDMWKLTQNHSKAINGADCIIS